MKRGMWILLVLSLALNVGFVSAALVHWAESHRGHAGAGFRSGGPGGQGPGWAAGHPGRGFRDGAGGRGDGRGRRMVGPRPGLLDQWPGRRIDRLHEAVGLTPEQREMLRDKLGELRAEIQANTRALMEERIRLHRALREGDAGAALVRSGARRVAELQTRLDSLVAESMIRENAILNPEQRRRYRDMEWGPSEEAVPPSVAP